MIPRLLFEQKCDNLQMESVSAAVAPAASLDILQEIAEVRSRLDLTMKVCAEQVQIMRSRCRALEQTMQSIGVARPTGRFLARQKLSILSQREMEVLRLIADGRSTKEIAYQMKMTFKTAVSHRTRLMKKLEAHETATLVRLAIRAGLVPADVL
jgi:DNA-binding NarL/FixJ family response regulator